jgi:hypothetical protein
MTGRTSGERNTNKLRNRQGGRRRRTPFALIIDHKAIRANSGAKRRPAIPESSAARHVRRLSDVGRLPAIVAEDGRASGRAAARAGGIPMIRLAAAIAIALCLSPSRLCAQSTVFTVNTASANVHKSPSTGSPVIGKAPRGAVLEVSRELGSWIKVVWPNAKDGAGYVHVSTGLVARGSTPVPNRAAGLTSARPAAAGSAAPPITAARPERAEAGEPAASTRTTYVRPPAHIVGVGGRMGGPNLGYGATARGWFRERLALQLEMSRYALNDAPGHLASTQFTPSLLYSLPGRVTDYLWVRPYLGAGPSLQRQTLSGVMAGAGDSVSDNRLGFQAFGGGEMTFASVPRFALSADLGYNWRPTSFAGFELGGLGLSVSGHWYIK